LIELVAIMVILAILSASAIPALAQLDNTRDAIAAKELRRDLMYARQRAIATGRRTWIEIDTAGESWSLLEESLSTPGRASATAINDRGTGRTYVVTLESIGAHNADILTASFDGAAVIGFDWIGRPLNSAETALSAAGTITVSGSQTITVVPDTGFIDGP
jgi:Tfp pilus assembly protein FimT